MHVWLTISIAMYFLFSGWSHCKGKATVLFLIDNNTKLLNNDTIDNTLVNFIQSILTKCFHWIFPDFYMFHQNDACFLTKKYVQNMNGFMVYLYHQTL